MPKRGSELVEVFQFSRAGNDEGPSGNKKKGRCHQGIKEIQQVEPAFFFEKGFEQRVEDVGLDHEQDREPAQPIDKDEP
jgi:hypothetical protein